MNYHVGQRVKVKSNDSPTNQEEYYAVINRITNRGNIFVDKLKSDKSGIEARGVRIKEADIVNTSLAGQSVPALGAMLRFGS